MFVGLVFGFGDLAASMFGVFSIDDLLVRLRFLAIAVVRHTHTHTTYIYI